MTVTVCEAAAMTVEPSAYVRRLPIGERIPFRVDGIPFWEVFPYEGDLRIKFLEEPTLPEPARHGEAGPEVCQACGSRTAGWPPTAASPKRWPRTAASPTSDARADRLGAGRRPTPSR